MPTRGMKVVGNGLFVGLLNRGRRRFVGGSARRRRSAGGRGRRSFDGRSKRLELIGPLARVVNRERHQLHDPIEWEEKPRRTTEILQGPNRFVPFFFQFHFVIPIPDERNGNGSFAPQLPMELDGGAGRFRLDDHPRANAGGGGKQQQRERCAQKNPMTGRHDSILIARR